MKINDFDVMAEMVRQNMPEIKAALDITNMNKNQHGTKVTIGVPFDCILPIMKGETLSILLLIDKKKFKRRDKMMHHSGILIVVFVVFLLFAAATAGRK